MGFAVVNASGIYAGAWSRWDNPPRPLLAGESVVEVEDPATLPQPAPIVLRHIAPYDFQSRFTDAELVAIQTSVDPILIRGRTKLQTIITYVDLDLEETQQLIGYLAILGIIVPERVAEILA